MRASAPAYDVVVAGLGAMGSAACWHLASRGLRVLGLDRYHPPHAQGSSHGGSRVIREMAFEHPRYVPLVRRAWELWDALEATAGRRLIIPTGALYLGPPASSVVAGSRASAVEHGIAGEDLDAAGMRERWPALSPEPDDVGLFEGRAGIVLPETSIECMLAESVKAGAELRLGEWLTEWRADGDGVAVTTSEGQVSAGALVWASGPWLLDELKRLAPGTWVERVVQHWFEPLRDASLLTPERCPIYLWEDAGGLIFYGFPMLDGALKCAIHHRGESTTVDLVRRKVGEDEVERVRERLERLIPAAAGKLRRSAVCLYTNTRDGDFIVDRHPDCDRVIVASPCSGIGFKFAPVIGELITDLVMRKPSAFDLQPFSFSRF